MKSFEFLTLVDILNIHQDQIKLYGGETGIRDINLISSALSVVESTFDEKYLHKDIFEMASAYLFYLCQNHPFIDGNKQTALASTLVFLDINSIEINDLQGKLYQLVIETAKGKMNKKDIAKVLKKLSG